MGKDDNRELEAQNCRKERITSNAKGDKKLGPLEEPKGDQLEGNDGEDATAKTACQCCHAQTTWIDCS